MNHLHLYHLGYRDHLFDHKFSVTVDLEAMLSIHIGKGLDSCLFQIKTGYIIYHKQAQEKKSTLRCAPWGKNSTPRKEAHRKVDFFS